MANVNTERESIRISGKLKEIVTIKDETGKTLHKFVTPLMVEFYVRDIIQVVVGATILAVPVGFTQEVWDLGSALPTVNIIYIGILSLLFISLFIYHNIYRGLLSKHFGEFLKRIFLTYLFSACTVALILTVINVLPWGADLALTVKRIILVTLPASMSAAVADMVK